MWGVRLGPTAVTHKLLTSVHCPFNFCLKRASIEVKLVASSCQIRMLNNRLKPANTVLAHFLTKLPRVSYTHAAIYPVVKMMFPWVSDTHAQRVRV